MNDGNLTQDGGDRWADTRRIVKLIENSLVENMTDKEVREKFGYRQKHAVTERMKRRIAAVQAEKAYVAMMAAWSEAALEPIVMVRNVGPWQLEEYRGGLLLQGIGRIAKVEKEPKPVRWYVEDTDQDCSEDPQSGEVLMFRRETYPSGWYAAHTLYSGPDPSEHSWNESHLAGLLEHGWFIPWWTQSPIYKWYLAYGPIKAEDTFQANYSSGRGAIVQLDDGRLSTWQVDYLKLGERNYRTGVNEAWAYYDEAWQCDRMVAIDYEQAGERIKLFPAESFVEESQITPNE